MSEVGLARSKRCIQEAVATDVLCTGHSRGLLVALRSEERLIALCFGLDGLCLNRFVKHVAHCFIPFVCI